MNRCIIRSFVLQKNEFDTSHVVQVHLFDSHSINTSLANWQLAS